MKPRTSAPDALTLSYRETWQALGIKKARFYELLQAGTLDHLRTPLPYKFSKARVEAWINGERLPGQKPWRAA